MLKFKIILALDIIENIIYNRYLGNEMIIKITKKSMKYTLKRYIHNLLNTINF